MQVTLDINIEEIYDALEDSINDAVAEYLLSKTDYVTFDCVHDCIVENAEAMDYVCETDIHTLFDDHLEVGEYVTADMITDVTQFEDRVRKTEEFIKDLDDTLNNEADLVRRTRQMRTDMMVNEEHLKFLFEKVTELQEARLSYKISKFWDLCKAGWAKRYTFGGH